jgi:hypothetical protein
MRVHRAIAMGVLLTGAGIHSAGAQPALRMRKRSARPSRIQFQHLDLIGAPGRADSAPAGNDRAIASATETATYMRLAFAHSCPFLAGR